MEKYLMWISKVQCFSSSVILHEIEHGIINGSHVQPEWHYKVLKIPWDLPTILGKEHLKSISLAHAWSCIPKTKCKFHSLQQQQSAE